MNEKTDVAHDRLSSQNAANETEAGTAASRLLFATSIWASEPAPSAPDAPAAVTPVRVSPAPLATPRRIPRPIQTIDAILPAAVAPFAAVAEKPVARDTHSPPHWPPRNLSLALQGGGTFAAFTWGVLERLLEEPTIAFDTISGASAGAINALLVACGLVEGGREGARARLNRFWMRLMHEASFRSLMLVGGFSPAGSSVAFGPTLRSGHFDPFDLDPLRQALSRDIDFAALREQACPKLLIAATRIRDGRQQIFGNDAITADVALASTCPPLVHCAIEIDGEAYWDGGYGGNPPLLGLVKETTASDLLIVQVTPSRDGYVPITLAAIDRRLDQIAANAALNAEIAAVEWGRPSAAPKLRLFKIAAEDTVDGMAQRSSADLGRGFIRLLHRSGREAADRWLRQDASVPSATPRDESAERESALV